MDAAASRLIIRARGRGGGGDLVRCGQGDPGERAPVTQAADDGDDALEQTPVGRERLSLTDVLLALERLFLFARAFSLSRDRTSGEGASGVARRSVVARAALRHGDEARNGGARSAGARLRCAALR